MKRATARKPVLSKSTSRAPASVLPARGGDVVLVAVTGMSPAILTETVWALAHENPRIIPRKVVAFGTSRSRDHLRRDLIASGVWENLRRALKAGPDELVFGDTGEHLRVFSHRGRELEDIRSPADNAAAADFILEHLRAFTDNPDQQVIASIAGGRKTMGALLYAAMTLIARETDRITHVLVEQELESRRDPPFFFPETAAEAKAVTLADVPFVPLRNKFVELGRMPGGFGTLVRHYSRVLAADGKRKVPIRLIEARKTVEVEGKSVRLPRPAFQLLQLLVELNEADEVPSQQYDLIDPLRARGASWIPQKGTLADSVEDAKIEIRKKLHQIRTLLAKGGVEWCPPKADLHLPPFRLLGDVPGRPLR